jgi:hypothetical protein
VKHLTFSGLIMGIVRPFPLMSMNSPLQNDDSYSIIVIVKNSCNTIPIGG